MNDEQVNTLKARLLRDRAQLVGVATHTEQDRVESVQPPGELSNAPTHPGDQDAEGLLADLNSELRIRHELDEVNAALRRIQDGNYGTCEECEGEISPQRLEIIPFTRHCVSCEIDLES